MKLLIYGSKGWIGQQFISYLQKENILIIEGKSRVNDISSLKEEILNHLPDNIITFIGRTHGKIDNTEYTTIDYLEQKGKIYENVRDNLFSPISLALLCKELNIHYKLNIHYTYLGTGCIFKYENEEEYGKEINGFTEECVPNFYGSSYSVVKGFTDMLMHQLGESVLNLRIRMPINTEKNKRNFIYKITHYNKICSIPNSMTVLPDFFPIILDLMENKTTGTLNLTNPGLISHNEILEMYREIIDPDFKWENFSIEEQDKILLSERSNNYLCTTKLEKMYPAIKNIKESVKDILINYK
jgi:dTDP-4-dehydrorhamnose reductase